MDFTIHYSIAFEDEALSLARRLFAYFDERIDSLALSPDNQDELNLYLDGILLHSYRRSGQVPRVSDAVTALARACQAQPDPAACEGGQFVGPPKPAPDLQPCHQHPAAAEP